MSIRYAILGLVAEAPSHGYAIRAAFEDRVGDFWDLNYGQVYQVLSALEEEGLITGSDERIGKRPTRRKYSVSPKGRDALRRWMAQPQRQRRPFRDDFYVRLMFAVRDSSDVVRAMIDQQVRCCRDQLAALADRRAAEARQDAGTAAGSTVSRLFTRAAILHAEAELKALDLCRATLEVDAAPAASVPRIADRPADAKPHRRGATRV
jgi:DNA-binding PadR family transcriptional regulator